MGRLQQLGDHSTADVGQAFLATVVQEGQGMLVELDAIENRGVEVADVLGRLDGRIRQNFERLHLLRSFFQSLLVQRSWSRKACFGVRS